MNRDHSWVFLDEFMPTHVLAHADVPILCNRRHECSVLFGIFPLDHPVAGFDPLESDAHFDDVADHRFLKIVACLLFGGHAGRRGRLLVTTDDGDEGYEGDEGNAQAKDGSDQGHRPPRGVVDCHFLSPCWAVSCLF